MIFKFLFRTIVLYCFALGLVAGAEESQYGHTTFDNSGADDAQASFMQGLLMLHSFEYSDARKAFQEAQGIDKDFAMAYWGEALTHYRVLWNEIELDKATAALNRLAETPAERANKAGSPREAAYLAAVEILISDESIAEKAQQYADAMEGLSADNPDDENAAAFHALALLGSSGPDRDISLYMRSAAISESIIAKNPRHPGAVHYLIHAYDDPVHAPLGLRPALAYSELAPAATHALHMPTHIFFPLGMWKEATELNTRSYAAGVEWGERNNKPVNGSGAHALTWLIYSLNQEGKTESARDHMEQFQALVGQDSKRKGQFTETWSSYLVDTDFADTELSGIEMDLAGLRPRHLAMVHYVKGVAALKAGNTEAANQSLAELSNLDMGKSALNWSIKAQDVMVLELQALIHLAAGENEEAVALLEQAVEIEYAMPRRFGPPWPPKPAHELFGEVLSDLGEQAGAKQQFAVALELANGRSQSLLGFARAASALDHAEDAGRAYATLRKNWSAADADFAPLQEAKDQTPMANR